MRCAALCLLLLALMPAAWPADQRSAEQAVGAAFSEAPAATRKALVALLVSLRDGDVLDLQLNGSYATFAIIGDQVQVLGDEEPLVDLGEDTGEPGGATEEPGTEAPAAAVAFLELLNAAREQAGLEPLELTADLLLVAASHSEDMSLSGFVGHEGSDGRDPFQRLEGAGIAFRAAAENVAQFTAQGATDNELAATAFTTWRDSAPHQKNMMNGTYTQCGVALAIRNGTCWATLVFIRPPE